MGADGAGAPLSVVFMGTPDFAATILKRVLEVDFLAVRAVFTRPDKPAGRGRKPGVSPVKALALEHALPVFQPRSFIRGPDAEAAAGPLRAGPVPDLLITAAYGLILSRRVLNIPKLGAVNVHASLLPLYRGAAPVHRALADGARCTGVSIMRVTEELDAGPILMQRAVAVAPNDTCGELLEELADAGAELLIECLQRLAAGAVRPVEQDAARATVAPKITEEECRVDFSLPAPVLHNRLRGLHPRPGSYMLLRRKGKADLRVLASPGIHPLSPAMRAFLECRQGAATACRGENAGYAADAAASDAEVNPDAGGGPGCILGLADGALLVACGDGAYAFTRLRPAGKADMEATAFYNGYLAGRPEAAFAAALISPG
ncbi:MAG: methionyl-tRNA formyltransferase [Desulfovibrio sp.]|jgi:methionyl-tRNA formyltransferase|nr:methionyl-tRNA formyltransferase [Desulfovibrio sp.]